MLETAGRTYMPTPAAPRAATFEPAPGWLGRLPASSLPSWHPRGSHNHIAGSRMQKLLRQVALNAISISGSQSVPVICMAPSFAEKYCKNKAKWKSESGECIIMAAKWVDP